MNLLASEFQKVLFTNLKDKKSLVLSILLFAAILIIALRAVTQYEFLPSEVLATVVCMVFLLRTALGGLALPNTELAEERQTGRIQHLLTSSRYSYERILMARMTIRGFVNLLISLFIVFLAYLFLPIDTPLAAADYLIMAGVAFVGLYSVIGIGLIIASLSWMFRVKAQVMILFQLLVFYVVFRYEESHVLVPFSHVKVLIYNLILHHETKGHMTEMILGMAANSVIYLALGLAVFSVTKYVVLRTRPLDKGE